MDMDNCRSFAKYNLMDCAKELLEWQVTGVLRAGKIRELSKMFGTRNEALSLAKAVVLRELLEVFVEDFCVLQKGESIDSSSDPRCPICDRHGVIFFDEPIDYWCCKFCGNVTVIGKDGLVGVLDEKVRYHPK